MRRKQGAEEEVEEKRGQGKDTGGRVIEKTLLPSTGSAATTLVTPRTSEALA